MSSSLQFVLAFAVFLSLMHIALYFPLHLLRRLLGLNVASLAKKVFLFSSVYILCYALARFNHAEIFRFLSYYLGIVSFAFFFSLFFWLVYGVCRFTSLKSGKVDRFLALSYLLILFSVSALSIFNFHKPISIESIDLQSDKVTRDYRFVHISDIQYGTSSKKEMEERLNLAFDLEPDFIVFTGDLIDFEGYSYDDFAIFGRSEVPIFFERGNHEFYHDPERLLSYLAGVAPIKLLLDISVQYEELDIVGVDYGREPGHLAAVLETIPLDPSRYSILLYHEPRGVEAAAAKGFDLLLFGHTHAGQIWPFTWLVDQMYRYADGLFNIGSTVVYTSDGVSLWGPRMRLGSQNEMVLFTISAKQ